MDEGVIMRRLSGLLALGLVVGAGVVAPTPLREVAAHGPGIQWEPCHEEAGPDFQCGTLEVPLDYDHPRGEKISLALVRLPATDQAHKKGTIFFNPGGPGGSGVEFVLGVGPFLYSDQVRARFDLVGFDPRGIIESSPLICFDSLDEAVATFWPFAFPMNQAEIRIAKHLDRQLINACDARGGAIQDHMATADVARDLDRLREAVGDFRLNYVGYSYGSFLGTTYANMFPNRVGAVVVDAVLDPIAWTTGRGPQDWKLPFSTRLHSDMGAQDTLDEFFRLCDEAGAGECAFAPNASDRFAALADLLKAGPIEVTDPETGETFLLRYSDLISGSLGELYNSFDWHPFAETLAFLEAAVGLSSTRAAADVTRSCVPRSGAVPSAISQLRRGLPRRRLLGQQQPEQLLRLEEGRDRSGRAVRLLRPALDVGVRHLRQVDGTRRGSLPRPVQQAHGQPRARGRQPVRPGDEVSGCTDRRQPAAQLVTAHRRGMGSHVAVPLGVRRRCGVPLPA